MQFRYSCDNLRMPLFHMTFSLQYFSRHSWLISTNQIWVTIPATTEHNDSILINYCPGTIKLSSPLCKSKIIRYLEIQFTLQDDSQCFRVSRKVEHPPLCILYCLRVCKLIAIGLHFEEYGNSSRINFCSDIHVNNTFKHLSWSIFKLSWK